MPLLDILQFPDAALRKVATPVPDVDGRIDQLVTDMLLTMYLSLIHISEPTRPY